MSTAHTDIVILFCCLVVNKPQPFYSAFQGYRNMNKVLSGQDFILQDLNFRTPRKSLEVSHCSTKPSYFLDKTRKSSAEKIPQKQAAKTPKPGLQREREHFSLLLWIIYWPL
ncbi:hypothetical protein ATANTOWER_023349, partial [Ataeniobius toweri]|nr:hypothetical protein [Ataeniobius toweri]